MPNFISTSLRKRLFSAAILAPLTVAIIWYGSWPFLVMLTGVFGLALYEWIHLARQSPHKTPLLIVGPLYLLAGFFSFSLAQSFSHVVAILFILLMWASDSGAYFSGKIFGGPKMSLEISPNKTWAGYAGALLAPALSMVVFLLWKGEDYVPYYMVAVIIGLCLGVTGQAGDLLISWLKRHVHVKDSGAIIPGHGGILDRIDSALLSAPFFISVIAEYPSLFVVYWDS